MRARRPPPRGRARVVVGVHEFKVSGRVLRERATSTSSATSSRDRHPSTSSALCATTTMRIPSSNGFASDGPRTSSACPTPPTAETRRLAATASVPSPPRSPWTAPRTSSYPACTTARTSAIRGTDLPTSSTPGRRIASRSASPADARRPASLPAAAACPPRASARAREFPPTRARGPRRRLRRPFAPRRVRDDATASTTRVSCGRSARGTPFGTSASASRASFADSRTVRETTTTTSVGRRRAR